MQRVLDYWRAEIARSPKRAAFLAACAGLFVVEVGMNMLNGYRRAGGDFQPAAFGYAAIMLMIGVIATWCAMEWRRARGVERWGYALLCVPLFFVCQSNGWAVMGVTMADGQVKREVAATGRSVVDEKLKTKREERAAIKVTRALAAIEAELNLELRRTSKQWPNGDGPAAMKLRAEKANALEAKQLDAEIEALAEALKKAPVAASGAVDVAVMMQLSDLVRGFVRGEPVQDAERTTAGAVSFAMSILLVFLIGFFATFGPALALDDAPPPGARPADDIDFGDSLADVFGLSHQRRLPPPPAYRRLAAEAATIVPSSGDGGRGGSATANSAPINIYVGADRAAADAASPASVEAAAGVSAPVMERREIGAIASDAPPIDRSRVRRHMAEGEREAADVLLAFVTACLVDAPGAATPLIKLYERYVAWAGERALAAQAFAALLPDATGVAVSEIGGVLHARGVVVRLGARVAAVA